MGVDVKLSIMLRNNSYKNINEQLTAPKDISTLVLATPSERRGETVQSRGVIRPTAYVRSNLISQAQLENRVLRVSN